MCCAYVPPHILADQFSDFLDALNEGFVQAKSIPHFQIIIMGDFYLGNTCLLPMYSNHSPVTGFEKRFEEELMSLQLTQLITEPTRAFLDFWSHFGVVKILSY